MIRKAIPLVLLMAIACSVAAGAAASSSLLPVVMVKKISPSELAGKTVEQAVWSRPLTIPRFEYYVCDYLPGQQTQVRLAYDDQNLYVAYTCLYDSMDKLRTDCTKRDDPVWKDDAVGIDLDIKHDHTFFHRLWSNAAGVLNDQDFAKAGLRQGDEKWNIDWAAKGAKESKAWTLFMTVPFKSLGVPTPKPGTMWGVNLARRSAACTERSCWATCRPAIQDLPAWGHFVFAGADTPAVYIEPSVENRQAEFFPCRDRAGGNTGKAATQIAVPGKHPLSVKILNPTSRRLPIRLDVLIDDKVTDTFRTTAAPGASDWNLQFVFPYEGLHEIKFAAYDGKGKLLMRSPYEYALVPINTARLAKYRAMVNPLRPWTASAKSEKASIEATLHSIAMGLPAALSSLAQWNALGAELDAVSMRIAHLRCSCADIANVGYAVGTESALTKILRDEAFDGEFGKPASMSLAKNEYESVQVCVLAHDRALKGVQVSVSDLKGPGGTVISGDRIKTNLVDWVDCGPARYAADFYGWIPDPLMDIAPFDVDKGALKPIWITVHAPENAPAGAYVGTVSIKPANAPATRVRIVAKVWDFAVPTRMHARTAFAYFEHEMPMWYGKPLGDEQRRQWYAFLLEHHISPTNIYSGGPVPARDFFQFCVDRGLNAFTLACTWYKDGKDLEDLESMIKDWEKYLKEHGWWDMPYIYGFDELGPERFEELKSTYGALKREFPGLHTMTTIAPQPELKGYVDYWCPQTVNYVHDIAEQYRKGGDEVWWYVCCNPFHPWPNYFIDYNAADPRVLWWMSWKENVPGILYYAINIWDYNCQLEDKDSKGNNEWERALLAGKRWPEIKWNSSTYNGDGWLIYPGPNGQPIGSIRLASIRDGIEDFEYFYMLDSLAKQAQQKPGYDKALVAKAKKLARIRDEAVKSPTEYSTDPKLLLGVRQEVAEMIEKLSR